MRDLALHLLKDGVDGLGNLVLQHLIEIDLVALLLDALRRTRPVALGPLRCLVLPRLLALPAAFRTLRSRPGVVLLRFTVRRLPSLVVVFAAGAARRVVVGDLRVSAARTRRRGLGTLPL